MSNLQFWLSVLYYGGLFGSLLAFADLWNIQFQTSFFKHSIEESSVMNAMIPIGVTVGGLVAGLWADKSGFIIPARVFGVLTVLFLALILYIPLPESVAGVTMLLIGFGFSGSILGLTTLQKNLPPEAVALATSLVITAACIFSGVVQTLIGNALASPHQAKVFADFLTGTIADFGTYQAGMMWIFGSAIISTLASFLFKEVRN